MGDNLAGKAVSQSLSEALEFKYKNATKSQISATRQFSHWKFDEYIIATGIFSILILK